MQIIQLKMKIIFFETTLTINTAFNIYRKRQDASDRGAFSFFTFNR